MRDTYSFENWHVYKLPDNGLYAPKGTNPNITIDGNIFRSDTNPLHPHVIGFVGYDGSENLTRKRILWNEIKEDITEEYLKSIPNTHSKEEA